MSILAQPNPISNAIASPPPRWGASDPRIDALTTAAAALGVLFVTVTGIILSYDALWALANAAGSINPALTWLWPLTLDALAVVASLNVLWAELRQERDRYAWALVIAFTVLSVAFNALHASLDQLLALHPAAPVIVSGIVGILPPIAAAFALHLLVRLLRRVLERVSLLASVADLKQHQANLTADLKRQQAHNAAALADLTGQMTTLTARREELRGEIEALRKEKRHLDDPARPDGAVTSQATIDRAREILRQQIEARLPLPTGAELGRQLNVSKTTGNNLKRLLLPALQPDQSEADMLTAALVPTGLNGKNGR